MLQAKRLDRADFLELVYAIRCCSEIADFRSGINKKGEQ